MSEYFGDVFDSVVNDVWDYGGFGDWTGDWGSGWDTGSWETPTDFDYGTSAGESFDFAQEGWHDPAGETFAPWQTPVSDGMEGMDEMGGGAPPQTGSASGDYGPMDANGNPYNPVPVETPGGGKSGSGGSSLGKVASSLLGGASRALSGSGSGGGGSANFSSFNAPPPPNPTAQSRRRGEGTPAAVTLARNPLYDYTRTLLGS
jgi:hypothetical protein